MRRELRDNSQLGAGDDPNWWDRIGRLLVLARMREKTRLAEGKPGRAKWYALIAAALMAAIIAERV